MKRGELWTIAGGPHYASKPRPAVIVQDDAFNTIESVTICMTTSNLTEAEAFRIPVEPTAENGLRAASLLMADKVSTLPRAKLGSRIGRLSDADLFELNRAILIFLGLASPPTQRRESSSMSGDDER